MKKIGLIGYGTIGRYICKKILDEKDIEVGFVFDPYINKSENKSFEIRNKFPENLKEIDLVVEAANSEAVKEYALIVLKSTNLLTFSTTAFADEIFLKEVVETSINNKTNIYIPHGAILGIDGINDGKSMLKSVSITTIKRPKNLGRKDDKRTVIYEGNTKGACKAYPKNVNVHGGVALAGIGFDNTKSKIIADPNVKGNTHIILAKGEGTEFEIKVSSVPKGLVSGVYTPESAFGSIKRILSTEGCIKVI